MNSTSNEAATAAADLERGIILASVVIAAPAERIFQALASKEITRWWVRPGVFDTREWEGDVRPGGTWQASGVARGQSYTLEGEFLEVDPPRALVHTWKSVERPSAETTLDYGLDDIDGATRVTLRHSGFAVPEVCEQTRIGWETSFNRLAELLAGRGQ